MFQIKKIEKKFKEDMEEYTYLVVNGCSFVEGGHKILSSLLYKYIKANFSG